MEILHKTIKCNFNTKHNLFFVGDLHLDNINHDSRAFVKAIKYINNHDNSSVILMGDLNDFIVNSSDPRFSPTEINKNIKLGDLKNLSGIECENIVKALEPIKDKIIASVIGNHEEAVIKHHAFDVYKEYSKQLGAQRLGAIGWIVLHFDMFASKHNYSIVCAHGEGRCNSEPGAVIRRCKDVLGRFDCDLAVMAHHHRMEDTKDPINTLSKDFCINAEKERYFATSGTFLKKYKIGSRSYFENKGGKNPDIGILHVIITPHRVKSGNKRIVVFNTEIRKVFCDKL